MDGVDRNLDLAEEYYGRSGWSFAVQAPTRVPGTVGEAEYIARADHAGREVGAEGYGPTRDEARADLLDGLDRVEPSLVMTAAEAERRTRARVARVAELHAIDHADSFVGMTEPAARDRAKDLGLILRVVSLDAPVMVTNEFVCGRVTAYIRGGAVTRTTAG